MKLLLILAAILVTGCVDKPAEKPELFRLGKDGFHCPDRQTILKQQYMLAIEKINYIFPECTFAGRDRAVTILSKPDKATALVELDGAAVWVFQLQLEKLGPASHSVERPNLIPEVLHDAGTTTTHGRNFF